MKQTIVALSVLLMCLLMGFTPPAASRSMIEAKPDTLLVSRELDSIHHIVYTVIIDTLSVDTVELQPELLPVGHSFTADVLIDYAKSFIGTPYRYSARGPSSFDCSGFTRYVFDKFGYKLENSSRSQFRSSDWREVGRDSLMVGDLVFFGGRSGGSSIGHVGIVASIDDEGDFSFIHASTSLGVCVTEFATSPYYVNRYKGARRVLSEYDTMPTEEEEVARLTIPPVTETKPLYPDATEEHLALLGEAATMQKSEAESDDLAAVTEEFATAQDEVDRIEEQTAAQAAEVSEQVQASYHIVVRGDTLYGIARAHGMSLTALCELNNIQNANTFSLFPGDRLRVM